ncbi:MAG: hypothetical protein ACI845_002647 [Gammaproteobacteria bacterium]|jgi:hypothetical protein
MSTDVISGFALLIMILAFACWLTRVDEKKYGKPKVMDYLLVLTFGSLWLSVFIAVFTLSPVVYTVTMFVIFALTQIISVGEGKRGLWRQIKDGCFLAWIASIPVCFMVWVIK